MSNAWGEESPLPVYSYNGSKLYLMIIAPSSAKTAVHWRAVNPQGRPVGRTRSMAVKLSAGNNKIELLVGDAGGHQLEFKVGEVKHRVWANRGVWYVAPTPLRVSKTIYTRGRNTAMMTASDLLFAGGMRAEIVTADGKSPLEIGRTLGYDTDFGLRVEVRQALVLVARGNVGPVMVTVAQRIGRKQLRYWDYSLLLGDRLGRYVIPFDKLRPRVGSPQQFKSIFAISLRSTNPVVQGGSLEVDYLGFTQPALVVKSAHMISTGVKIDLEGARQSEAELWVSWGSGDPVRTPLARKRTALVTEHDARQFWVCYLHPNGGHGCDPPDAPATAYALPRGRGTPVLIDDFSLQAPINFFREPTEVFASSVIHQQQMQVQRGKGTLLLRYHPTVSGDYAGYKSPLPVSLPKDLHTIELKIRGELSPATVTVGLRDAHGREPRAILRSYTDQLGDKWRTVFIPIEAFQAILAGYKQGPRRLGPLQSISITMDVSTTPAVHQIELKSIRLLPIRVPLAIVRFDGERAYRSALGGGLLMESRQDAKIVGDLSVAGKSGNGMLLNVSSVTERGYALMAIGLGQVDVRAYSRLRFWVKLKSGALNAVLYLSDGKKKARVELNNLVQSSTQWQPVSIPLAKLEPQVNLSRLTQVILAWEEQLIVQESVVVDEFFFE